MTTTLTADDLRKRISLRVAQETPPGLTASVIIDSLGRRWTPSKHPRDRKGRFIETFGEVRGFMRGKSYTKPDFSGRVVAMNPDGTAIVQISGGRGGYASASGRMVKVSMDQLEMAEFKARLGKATNIRPATPDEAREIQSLVQRMRTSGKKVVIPDFDTALSPEDQYARVEEIAELAEDYGFPDERDSLLNVKSLLRGEDEESKIEDEVKAILGVKAGQEPQAPEGEDNGGAPEAAPEGRAPAPGAEVPGPAAGQRTVRERIRQAAVDGGLWSVGGTGTDSEVFESRLNMAPEHADAFSKEFGRAPREWQELKDPQTFLDRLHEAKVASPHGAMVTEYTLDAYDNPDTRLFTSADGLSGFALRDGEIVSVFSHPTGPRNALDEIMPLAIQNGGNRLDAFDAGLGGLYGRYGFKASARMKFDPDFKPDDWDDTRLGAPDILFMHHDPNATPPAYADGDGDYVTDYDEGIDRARKDAEDANGAKARIPGPAEPEPDEPAATDVPAGGEREPGGVPGEGAAESQPEPKLVSKKNKLPVPRTVWQAWAMLLGFGNMGEDIKEANSRLTDDTDGSRRVLRGPKEVADHIGALKLDATGNYIVVNQSPDPDSDAAEVLHARLEQFDVANMVEEGSLAERAAQRIYDHMTDLDNQRNLAAWPALNDSLINLERALRVGDLPGIEQAWGNVSENVLRNHDFDFYLATRDSIDKIRNDPDFAKARAVLPENPTEWTDIDPTEWTRALDELDMKKMVREANVPGVYKALRRYLRVHNGDIPQRVMRKGDMDIAVMHHVDDDVLVDFVKAFEEVSKDDPIDGRKIAMLNDFGKIRSAPAEDHTYTAADAVPGGRVSRFNIRLLTDTYRSPKVGGNFLMPAGYVDDGYQAMKYVVRHEYGHMRGPHISPIKGESLAADMRFVFKDAGLPDLPEVESFDAWVDAYKKGKLPYHLSDFWTAQGKPGSGYEMYAEFYAEFMQSDGKTDNKYVQAVAKHYGWEPQRAEIDPAAGDGGDVFAHAAPPDVNERFDAILDVENAEDYTPEDMGWIADHIDEARPDFMLSDLIRTAFVMAQKKDRSLQSRGNFYNERILDFIEDERARDVLAQMFAKLDSEYGQRLIDNENAGWAWGAYVRKGDPKGDMWRRRFPTGLGRWLNVFEQENAAAAFIDGGYLDYYTPDDLQEMFPEANIDPDRMKFLAQGVELYHEISPMWSWYDQMLVIVGPDHRTDAAFRDDLAKAIWLMRDTGKGDPDKAEGIWKLMYPGHDIDAGLPARPEPDHEDWVEKPDPIPVPDEDKEKFGDTARNLAEEFFRGRSKRAKRGVGNLHLAERYAHDKDGNEIRKGDVVWFDEAPGKHKRPAADGFIQNIVVETYKDADGNRRPRMDAAGNPIIKKIVVRHFDPKYIGTEHVNPKLRAVGHKWPFPYMDYEIASPNKVVRFIPDDNPRAQAVIDQFGLHGRRMAGRGAGRFAPIVGKVFRLDRMRNAVPIQNRFLRDASGRLIGEGDVVKYRGELFEVLRPNNPWDNKGNPRVMIRPVGGGALKQPTAAQVQFVDEAKDGQLFFRGAGGIAAPTPGQAAQAMRNHGIYDRAVHDAIAADDVEALAKALAANPRIQEFLDKEAAQRKAIRDRIEIDNRGHRIPPGHMPVTEGEYMRAQRDKADAVILLAAKAGFFADDDGKPRDLDDKIRKDLYGEYVGDEADIAMRSAYNGLYDAIEELTARPPVGGEDKDERDKKNNRYMVLLNIIGNARLNDLGERKDAEDAISEMAGLIAREPVADVAAAKNISDLDAALAVWAKEFDERQGALAGPPAPGPAVPPAGPPAAGPISIVRPPAPAAPAAPAELPDNIKERLRRIQGKGNAFIGPDAKEAIKDILLGREPKADQMRALRKDMRRSMERYKDPARKRPDDAKEYQEVLDALDKRFPGLPETVDTPAAPEEPKPVTVKFDQDAANFMNGRADAYFSNRAKEALKKLMAGEKVTPEEFDHLISELEKNRDRYADAGRERERSYAQNLMDAADYAQNGGAAPAPTPEPEPEPAPAEPLGRTDAIDAIFNRINEVASDLRNEGERAKARKLAGRADDIAEYFDKAQAAHEAGDKEARDRWLNDVELALDGMAADGHEELARELRPMVAGNRARFDVDDNAIDPMGFDEGMDAIFDAADPILRDLRKKGPDGRKKARDLQAKIDQIEENLEKAESADDDAARDALLDDADEIAVGIGDEFADVRDIAQDVVKRNGARMKNKAESPDDLSGRAGDPGQVDEVDGTSPAAQRLRDVANALKGLSIRETARGQLPQGLRHRVHPVPGRRHEWDLDHQDEGRDPDRAQG